MPGFAENFIAAYSQGRQLKQQKDNDLREEEERKLRIDALKHQQKQIELEGRWKLFDRQRSGAKEAAGAMEGRPMSELVKPTTYGQMGPAQGENLPAQPMALPMAPDGSLSRQKVNVPGSEEFGVQGYSITPRSQEEGIEAQLAALIRKGQTEAMFQKHAPGEVTPALGAEPPAGPKVDTSPTQPSLERELLTAIRNGDAEAEKEIRAAMNARDVNMGGGTPRQRFSIQPVTKPDGTTGLARVNVETGDVTMLNPADGTMFGKPTDGERKASDFFTRGSAADDNALTFEDDLTELGEQFQSRLPNLLTTQQGQQYAQAKREFTEARLRAASGAAIAKTEYENDDKMYFVQPGDTEATIQQKQAARQRVLRGLKRQAGNLGASATPKADEPAAGVKVGGFTVREKK